MTHNAYDTDAWEQLLAKAFTLPIAQARLLYERFLSLFPFASRYWRQYILHEQSTHHYAEVEALFARCLLPTLSLPLFQTYIDYVKHVKAGTDDLAEALERAYEFSLSHISLDLSAPTIFLSYLAFLSTLPAPTPMDETLKMQKQRKVYQRAVVIPGHGVEDLWREWDRFEHAINKVLAGSLLSGEWNQRHLQAKAVGKERKRRMRGIKADLLSTPPSPQTALVQAQQLLLWKSLIAYERTNPLHLSPIDHHHAVTFTYRQALTFLSHHPPLWHEYLTYLSSASLELAGVAEGVEEGWKEAHAAMPYSLTMGFMYAEWLEEKGRLSEAKRVYEGMIDGRKSRPRDALERVEEGLYEVKRRIAPLVTAAVKAEGDGVKMEDGEGAHIKVEEGKTDGVEAKVKREDGEGGEDEAEKRMTLAEQAEDEEAAARSQLLHANLCVTPAFPSTMSSPLAVAAAVCHRRHPPLHPTDARRAPLRGSRGRQVSPLLPSLLPSSSR